jgi:hypothetical protein
MSVNHVISYLFHHKVLDGFKARLQAIAFGAGALPQLVEECYVAIRLCLSHKGRHVAQGHERAADKLSREWVIVRREEQPAVHRGAEVLEDSVRNRIPAAQRRAIN